jgi:hypothetical protein
LHKFQGCEFGEEFWTEFVADLFFYPFAFLFDVKTAEVNVVFCLPACDSYFGGRWWWKTSYAGNLDLIFPYLLDFDVLKLSCYVAVVILGAWIS